MMGRSFLIIQTAFIGDAILATSLAEKIKETMIDSTIDFLVRKGNESLFENHPFIREVLVWDKKKSKYKNLFKTLSIIRSKKYDTVINLQRFMSTGILTAFSGANEKIGFNKNPLSFLFTRKVKHELKKDMHEIDRNQTTIHHFAGQFPAKPKLYPSESDFQAVNKFKQVKYITISPSSVWFTKTFPAYKWIELIQLHAKHHNDLRFYLLGSSSESVAADDIIQKSGVPNVINLSGKLSFLESAALMKDAVMNYVNDSAPLHLASSINAVVTAVYCSTIPEFGFGPLSENSTIIQTPLSLDCRPCGLHGFKECPLLHFKCAHSIIINEEILS